MARHYSPKSFLRHAPNSLLERYFRARGIPEGIDWDYLRKTEVEPIIEFLGTLDEKTRREIESDLRSIESMACEAGSLAIMQEAHVSRPELATQVQFPYMDQYERAFSVFLDCPAIFEVARRIDYAKHVSFVKLRNLPAPRHQIGTHTEQVFAAPLSAYYQREGRGHGCDVEYLSRGGKHYWFVLLADYPQARQVYDEENRPTVRSDRPAFDLVFVYDEVEGTLDTHAPGGRTIVADLQRIFGRVILGEEMLISPSMEMVYNLNGLLDRNFEFPTQYQYGIDSVRVKKLRCTILGRSKTALTLESGDETRTKPVHDLLDDLVASERITKELLTVVQAGLQITFGGNLTRRRRTLSFTASSPNSCSPKFEPKHEIARQCMKDWGLDVSGSGNRSTQLS